MSLQQKQPNLKVIRNIPFIDLEAQQVLIRKDIDIALQRVLDHGKYIMGPEIQELEKQLAQFCGVKHAITCSNGTDALTLALRAKNVKPGDAILVPSFTFAASAEVIALIGAIPVFIDSLPDTYNMDPESLKLGISTAKKHGLHLAGVIAVDIFGQAADYDVIESIARENNMWVIADAAQSFGGTYGDKSIGNIGDIATTSFFPAKPLGCYGDGGAVFTNDDSVAEIMESLRVHGKGTDKYDNVRIGLNARLDTMQAAILLQKLKLFPAELEQRQKTAELYNVLLKDVVHTPTVIEGARSAWAQYTVTLPKNVDRDALIEVLKTNGIPSVVYYVKPLHLQTAYKGYPTAGDAALPVCEALAEQVLSLPMSGYVKDADVHFIAKTLIEFIDNS